MKNAGSSHDPGHGVGNPLPYRTAKAAFEKAYLSDLLTWAKGNVKRAAEQAGRDRKGLYILMTKHGLNPMSFRRKNSKINQLRSVVC